MYHRHYDIRVSLKNINVSLVKYDMIYITIYIYI